jgi:carbonic anhydrase
MDDERLRRLLAGNQRFVAGNATHPNQSPVRRQEVVAEQQPVAAILGCADSRVPPEIIFDQGLGDLFTVRVAGNGVNAATLGSLEYAVDQLGVRLIVVLGHSSCGAVRAALSGHAGAGQISTLVASIQLAVQLSSGQPGDAVDRAVRANAAMVARQLRSAAPVLAPLVSGGRLRIAAAYYDLAGGVVELLE